MSSQTPPKTFPGEPPDDGARVPRGALTRLDRILKDSVAVFPAPGVDAPADLAARFTSVLNSLGKRQVSADVLFETLRLETLDWGMDRDVPVSTVETTEKATEPAEIKDRV